jgi:hypothetical protein
MRLKGIETAHKKTTAVTSKSHPLKDYLKDSLQNFRPMNFVLLQQYPPFSAST